MVAGWDGTTVENPGYPHDETWQLRWESLMAFYSVDLQPECIN